MQSHPLPLFAATSLIPPLAPVIKQLLLSIEAMVSKSRVPDQLQGVPGTFHSLSLAPRLCNLFIWRRFEDSVDYAGVQASFHLARMAAGAGLRGGVVPFLFLAVPLLPSQGLCTVLAVFTH